METATRTDDGMPHVKRAHHAGDVFNEVERHCRVAVGGGAVHHLGHYSSGVLDLSVDILETVPPLVRFDRTLGIDKRRADLARLGRQLFYTTRLLEEALRPVSSGPLIRAVFDAGDGAIIYLHIDQGAYLVGAALSRDETDAADRALAAAAEAIRWSARRPNRDPGGFIRADENDLPLEMDPDTIHRDRGGVRDVATERFERLAAAALQPTDLHYVARFTDTGTFTGVDVLDDRRLDAFFTHIDRARRRNAYRLLSTRVPGTARTLDADIRPVLGRPLFRTVLDIEQGALYFYRTGPDEYLLGVTLNQTRVKVAEMRFADLVEAFARDDTSDANGN